MRKNNKKGFTLAELLIVVAIIAVLTAIAIPVFTSQLEKSREATDLSNIRAAYAEISAALLTENMNLENAECKVLNGLTAKTTGVSATGFTVTVTSFPIKQTVPAWQTTNYDVAGVNSISLPATLSATGSLVFTFTINGNNTYVSGIAINAGA